jgi:hypothetical protein
MNFIDVFLPVLEGGSADFVRRLWVLRRTSSGPSSSPSKDGPHRRHLWKQIWSNKTVKIVFYRMFNERIRLHN